MLDFPSRYANVEEMSRALKKFRKLLESEDFSFDRAIFCKFLSHLVNEEVALGLIGQIWHYIFNDRSVRRRCRFTSQTTECLQLIVQRCLRKGDKNSKSMLTMLGKEIEKDEFGKECAVALVNAYIRESNSEKIFKELCEFVKGNGSLQFCPNG